MSMKVYSRRKLMAVKPYDTEIEYLQVNTAGPYIDTGIIGNTNLNYEVKFGYKMVSGYPYIFGAQQAEKQRRFSLMISSWANHTLIVNNGVDERNFTFSAAEAESPLVVKKVGLNVYVNGSKKTTFPNTTYTTPLPITVFACKTPAGLPGNRLIGLPIYYFKIGNLDLIPVRKGDVGYFYDKNSHKLFGNAGTGNFILGPDVKVVGGGKCLSINNLCRFFGERRAA